MHKFLTNSDLGLCQTDHNKPNDNIFTDFSVISLNHLNVFRSSSQIFLLTVHLSTFEKYYLFISNIYS